MRARVLASKLLHFVSSTDGFILLDYWVIIGWLLVIIGTLEKRLPGHIDTEIDFVSGNAWGD